MKEKIENLQELREENMELRKALAFCMSHSLIKNISEALEKINNGEYVSEEEFFSDSPQEDA